MELVEDGERAGALLDPLRLEILRKAGRRRRGWCSCGKRRFAWRGDDDVLSA